jgi:hypothetical protein
MYTTGGSAVFVAPPYPQTKMGLLGEGRAIPFNYPLVFASPTPKPPFTTVSPPANTSRIIHPLGIVGIVSMTLFLPSVGPVVRGGGILVEVAIVSFVC